MISKLINPEVIQFIQQHEDADPHKLMLEFGKHTHLPLKDIVVQIASRKKAKRKLPEWYANRQVLFPPKENLEQSSSQRTAEFKQRFCSGKTLLDATGGTGIDTFYLSKFFDFTTYLEPDAHLCDLARHNFSALGADIKVVNSDLASFLKNTDTAYDVIYLDPSRRDSNQRKVYQLTEYQPDITAYLDQLLARSSQLLIKISPMADIKQTARALKNLRRIQTVAVENEMKELLFHIDSKKEQFGEPIIECWNLTKNEEVYFDFTFSDEKTACVEYSELLTYIYEPNTAIRKAGAFRFIAHRFDVSKVHTSTHLYTSGFLKESFPGRIFKVIDVMKPQKKILRKKISPTINVLTKNYPVSTTDLKKKFGLTDGGERYLIFCETRTQGRVAIHAQLIVP